MRDLETHHKVFWDTVWHEIFAGSKFCDFPVIRKNKFPKKKKLLTANIFLDGKNLLQSI